MNKFQIILGALVLLVSGQVNASLIDRGGGLIYDTDLNVTWLQDANFGFGSSFDSIDGTTDGRMRWVNAKAWSADLSYYDSVRDVTYDDWRLPATGPVNGISLNFSVREDGSSDMGHNISAPGSIFAGSTGSEMAHLFYNSLDGIAFVDTSGAGPQTGWGLGNTGPFINFQIGAYWSGTPFTFSSGAAIFFAFGSDTQVGVFDTDVGGQFAFSKDSRIHALAVRDGDVFGGPPIPSIPIPATLWLFGTGIIGLIGFSRRRKFA